MTIDRSTDVLSASGDSAPIDLYAVIRLSSGDGELPGIVSKSPVGSNGSCSTSKGVLD
jgi:hypothetical protein